MITSAILTVLLVLIGAILSPLPNVTALPFGMDGFIINAGGYLRAFVDVFWPMQPVLNALFLYFTIKLSLMVLRFFIGERAPDAA